MPIIQQKDLSSIQAAKYMCPTKHNQSRTIILHLIQYDLKQVLQYIYKKMAKLQQMEILYQVKQEDAQKDYQQAISSQNFKEIHQQILTSKQQPILKKKKHKRYNLKGKWSPTENLLYLNFLMTKGYVLELRLQTKRALGTNVMISQMIETRNAIQCHSHHQKMMLRYGSIDSIITNLAIKYGLKNEPQNSCLTKREQQQGQNKQCPKEQIISKREPLTSTENVKVQIEEEVIDYIYFE